MSYIPKVLRADDVIRHGDYAFFNEHATVLKVTNIRRNLKAPVICFDDDDLVAFEQAVGFQHTDETWIRSYLLLNVECFTDENVHIINNVEHPEEYLKALVQHFTDVAYDYSYEYDAGVNKYFSYVCGCHYEFELPSEFYCVIPMELGAWYEAARNTDAAHAILGQLAYGYFHATVPITNIRIVADE